MTDVTAAIGGMRRRRLPSRRPAVTERITFLRGDGGHAAFDATIGFDELARPKEIFLCGAKAGSEMAAVLDDAAVAISVALQHGVSAEAMARSTARLSQGEGCPALPGSIIGAALDLLVRIERSRADELGNAPSG